MLKSTDHWRGGACWPSPEQELLLRAALLPSEAAATAWHTWKSGVDFEHDYLDQGSYRLLPLLYCNLREQGVKDPLMGKLKGIYRMTWAKNHLLFHHMADILRAFHDAGIETLVLKGAALVLRYYRDYGIRPMNDFDVLVPTARAAAATKMLLDRGWKPKLRPPDAFTAPYFSLRHSDGFVDAERREFDLHWHILPECCGAHADDDFWTGAAPLEIRGMTTRALNPTDQLLHVCLNGVEWNPVPPVRWVADAMTILRAAPEEIDWARLTVQAEKRQLLLALRNMLEYLHTEFAAPIPTEVLVRMQAVPISKLEWLEYWFKIHRVEIWGGFPVLWFLYLRNTTKGNVLSKLAGFPGFLRDIHEIEHVWRLPRYIFSKIALRGKAALSRRG